MGHSPTKLLGSVQLMGLGTGQKLTQIVLKCSQLTPLTIFYSQWQSALTKKTVPLVIM